MNVWQSTWDELNVNGVGIHDDFHRFKTKLAFMLDGKPVAFHGYSEFNLKLLSDRNHTYFKKLQAPVVDKLLEKGLYKIATTEYMCVHKDFRKISNHYLGEILGGFSAQYFRNTDYDAMMTVARNDRSVNKMCKMYGAYPVYEKLPLNNVDVDIMVFEPKNIKDNLNPEIQSFINNLFNTLNPQIGVAA
ncbi:MAG: hypothetical protein KDD37_00325 [Bdellovibrionales bacterium]|nr:hypothetical protein [Bdellovibrionales bacterium]